jgi:hypothetical protein
MREGLRFWQGLALIALVAATAGWTTVAVIALRPAPAAEAAASPAEVLPTFDPLSSDVPSEEPPVESHAVPALEALLPAQVNRTTLTRESWTGDTILSDDAWSTSMTTFLTGAGKTAADLETSQAYDATGAFDISAGAFRVAGLDATKLRDAMIAAWKGDYPDLKVATTTMGGLAVTTGDFGQGAVNSYWYVRGGVVFDIETSDPAIAQAALTALPKPAASPGASPS